MSTNRTGPAYIFSDEQEKRVVSMYQSHTSIKAIARHFEVNEKTVRASLLRAGIELRGRTGHRKHFLAPRQLRRLVTRYAAGANTEELAEEFGMTPGTVASRLDGAGVALRSPGFQRGEAHHNWAGGRVPTSDGYIQLLVYPNDPFYSMAKVKSPNENGGRYVLEHRLVMAKHLGRCLTEAETVHHKDLDHSNNKLDNLQLRHGKHGKGASFRCCDCGSYNVEAASL